MSPLSALLVLFVADACALHAAVAPAWTHARGPMVAHATHARPAMHFKLDAVAQRMPTIRMSAPVEEPRRTAKVARVVARTMSTFAVSMLLPAIALAAGAPGEKLHLGEKVALFFQGFGLPDWAVLALISATPAIELRGGVPVGNWMGLSPALTFLICVVGNMAPIAPMLWPSALRSSRSSRRPSSNARRRSSLACRPDSRGPSRSLCLLVCRPRHRRVDWSHHCLPPRYALRHRDGLHPCWRRARRWHHDHPHPRR